jgi:hypothetical protein
MKTAVGVLIKDRIELTKKTLESLSLSSQPKYSYDIFLLSNGSAESTNQYLRSYIDKSLLPIKNLVLFPGIDIPMAWNFLFSIAFETRDYSAVVKVDNDVVLSNVPLTPDAPLIKPRRKTGYNAGDFGSNPGAIPSGPPRVGAAAASKNNTSRKDSSFIEHMSSFASQYNVDIVSLPPIQPRVPFVPAFVVLNGKRWRNKPYAKGGFTLITRKCFESIGYMNEGMPLMSDVEYSQRAMESGLNAGYHDGIYCVHLGHERPTLNDMDANKKQLEANKTDASISTDKAGSQWEDISKQINDQLLQNRILNMQD